MSTGHTNADKLREYIVLNIQLQDNLAFNIN